MRGVPTYTEKRNALLPLARSLARLPAADLAAMENAESFYSVGWSHGREKFQGKPDVAKGSFYANPLFDRVTDDEALTRKYLPMLAPNIWPGRTLPQLQVAFKALGQLLVRTGVLVARACDSLVARRLADRGVHIKPSDDLDVYRDGYTSFGNPSGSALAGVPPAGSALAGDVGKWMSTPWPLMRTGNYHGGGPRVRLERVIRESRVPKGRLLYYFPLSDSEAAHAAKSNRAFDGAEEDSWCGWHNDHGSLTGLCSAMFIDEVTGQEIACPDPTAGLYARRRDGQVQRVVLPRDCMGFQIGESAQIHSGGILQATPHAVRAVARPGIARAQLAVFMEPEWDWPMMPPRGIDPQAVLRDARGRVLPKGVPQLEARWSPSDDFDKFSIKTLSSYY